MEGGLGGPGGKARYSSSAPFPRRRRMVLGIFVNVRLCCAPLFQILALHPPDVLVPTTEFLLPCTSEPTHPPQNPPPLSNPSPSTAARSLTREWGDPHRATPPPRAGGRAGAGLTHAPMLQPPRCDMAAALPFPLSMRSSRRRGFPPRASTTGASLRSRGPVRPVTTSAIARDAAALRPAHATPDVATAADASR